MLCRVWRDDGPASVEPIGVLAGSMGVCAMEAVVNLPAGRNHAIEKAYL